MLKRFKRNINIDELLTEINNISKKHDIINICVKPTGYAWLGVRNAGKSLFPENTIEIPQYYSNRLLNPKQTLVIANKIIDLNFKQIVFNGFNDYFDEFVIPIKKANKKIKIAWIHHGFLAELNDEKMCRVFSKAISLIEDNKIDKVGFAKKGLDQTVKKLYNIPSFYIIYKNPVIDYNQPFESKIGVLVNHTFRKNIANQMFAALLVKNRQVVVNKSIDFLKNNDRIIEVGHLDHDTFLKTLSKNELNMHITFSEASGGQVFTESLAVGTPCLTSYNSGYLDYNDELKHALTVARFDDSWGIYEKAEEVLKNRDYISKLGIKYSKEMNQRSEFFLNNFLNY